ncbi:hypothetical protein F5984_10680 [Rudanella paleaurantiibacter]|uniref:Chemotaxis methyl-accepting receptor HlyB-like 4HB MCP domain-containing protein n=1 Tax=Rudanella paleaurantiibacter TaxID=2614655 RepID=A0A7J5U0H9_9BACT|nr:MCP four helix bundle domain-containing protein [Rudanella paleaurantiibacter]KAB7731258.1 hypothetical protein F5984_10680 [Rudanella paleaurantiibacter]
MKSRPTTLRDIILFASFLGLILVSVFLCRRALVDIQEMTTSIYEDRLVPTALVVNLTSAVYRKRMLLEKNPPTEGPAAAALQERVKVDNQRVDSLITDYTKTKLTTEEAGQLRLFQQQLADYNKAEAGVLNRTPTQTADVYSQTLLDTFGQMLNSLNKLATLQLTVGEDVLEQARQKTRYILILTALQIGLILLIGSLMLQRSVDE